MSKQAILYAHSPLGAGMLSHWDHIKYKGHDLVWDDISIIQELRTEEFHFQCVGLLSENDETTSRYQEDLGTIIALQMISSFLTYLDLPIWSLGVPQNVVQPVECQPDVPAPHEEHSTRAPFCLHVIK